MNLKYYKYCSEKLAFERVNLKPFIWSVSFIIVSLCCSSFCLSSFLAAKTETKVINGETIIHIKTDRDFSENKLIEEIKKYNFKWPEIILAQAKVESGNYKSLVFKNNHNLFGLKISTGRCSSSNISELGYAKYDSWMYSVSDRAAFEAAYLRKINTKKEYIEYLNKNYAEAGNYGDKILEIIKENNLKTYFK